MDTVIQNVANELLAITNTQILAKGDVFNNLEQTQIKIGKNPAFTQAANSIILNATGANLSNTIANSCIIKPIRYANTATHILTYDDTSGEVRKQTVNEVIESAEQVNITGCTASDTWIITTDNETDTVYPQVTLSLDPASASTLAPKQSPQFTSNGAINYTATWPSGTWTVSASGEHQSLSTPPWNAFDGSPSTSWRANDGTFNSTTGVGLAWIQMEYPAPQKMISFTIVANVGTNVNTSQPSEWTLQGSNDGLNFFQVGSYGRTSWTDNVAYSYNVPEADAYRYWRIQVTKVVTASTSICRINELQFFTGLTAAGLRLSSVLPVANSNPSQFKIVMTDERGTALIPANIPIPLPFYITLIKDRRVVNTGLYTLSLDANNEGVLLTA
jgi:hypothetical protein